MKHAKSFTVHPGLRILMKDLGIHPADVLRRAGLPDDLLTRGSVMLSTDEYFAFWQGLEAEAGDTTLPLRIGNAISVESFDAPIFAALCSPDFNGAIRRLSRFKRLIGPLALHIEQSETSTSLQLEWLDKAQNPPVVLVASELVFFVQLARLATREEIIPIAVTMPEPPEPVAAYTRYFGCQVEPAPLPTVTLSGRDASRPFLTANEAMWRVFHPELRNRLWELDAASTTSDRVRAAFLELLPGGHSSLREVAEKLGLSTRTLQRRLSVEGATFQLVLKSTREELARHYLGNSTMPAAEIALLLGFSDPNSFFRAFLAWTGSTPEQVRAAARVQ